MKNGNNAFKSPRRGLFGEYERRRTDQRTQSDWARAQLRGPVGVDIGAGEIDVIWTRKDHANLPTSKLGFFFCPTGGEIPTDFLTQSVAKALLSVCDKAIFLVRDDASLKSVKGKINALDAIGGVLQLKKYAHAITSNELLGGLGKR